MTLEAFAPAKVNLFLHVGPTGADGFHPLSSWMTFADIGDRISIGPSEEMAFDVAGPFAAGVPRNPDNLVLQARDAMLGRRRDAWPPFRLLLHKALPVASGIGGGSSDAAATLRLLSDVFEIEVPPLLPLALGADVPACFAAAPRMVEGRGEVLFPAPAVPPLDAVLVNPGVPVSTGAVFAGYDRSVKAQADTPELPPVIGSPEEAAAILSICRNDLEGPAIELEPAVGEVLDLLRDQAETLLARMSGSGATCFALCSGATEADSLAERLQLWRPDWWVAPCRLGGPWSAL